jgi:hypothetical protein
MENKSPDIDELPEWVKFVNEYSKKNKRKEKTFEPDKLSIESLVFKRVCELYQPIFPDKIIRFPLVFSKICPIYCLTKGQAWSILKRLEEFGLIEIVPYQGIKIMRTSLRS